MKMKVMVGAVAALLLAIPAGAGAQGVALGPQLSYGGDTDLGVGLRVLANLESLEHWDFLGTFDVWLPDDPPGRDVSAWEINGNLAYNFLIEDVESVFPYVGGGLNIFHVSVSDDDSTEDFDNTDLGLNIFGGTKFQGSSITPFVEVRAVLEGAEQVVITGGVLF